MKPLHLLFLFVVLGCASAMRGQNYSVNTVCSTPFEDISQTGAPIALLDDETRFVALPFNFAFYDRTYSSIGLSNNGGIFFGSNVTTVIPSINLELPNYFTGFASSSVIQAAMFPFWDDLGVDAGAVYFDTRGTAPSRRFIVQWHNRNLKNSTCVPFSNCGVTFQVVLYEATGDFAFVYDDLFVEAASPHNNGAQATVGIQRDKNIGRELSFNSSYLAGRTCITFTKVLTTENSMRYGVQSDANCTSFISFLGTNLNLFDDQLSNTINLPFDFNYYGRVFKKIRISNNGHVYLEDEGGVYSANRIDVYQTDIDQDRGGFNGSPTGGGVFYQSTSSYFVVEWRNLPAYYASNSGITFQLQLYSNGQITFSYKDLYAGNTANASAPYRSYGNQANIGLVSPNVVQTVFSNEQAIQVDGAANVNPYCLKFYRPTVEYNNMPSCVNNSQANIIGSSQVVNFVSLIDANGVTVATGSGNGYTISTPSVGSFQVMQTFSVSGANYLVPNYSAYSGSQILPALSPIFSVPRTPRARMDVFPNDTICSTEYAVLFANSGGLNAPSYLWNAGAQTAQAIQADSSAIYRVTITDRHNNCADAVQTTITKRPNSLIDSVTFERIAVGQPTVRLDDLLLRLEPDSLVFNVAPNQTYPRTFEGNYVNFLAGIYEFSPQQAGVGTHPVTVVVQDTATGCLHSRAGFIEVLPNPQFIGLDTVYCGSVTNAMIYRDSANYPYVENVIGVFTTNQAYPNNIQFIRLKRNLLTITATNYALAGTLPTNSTLNAFGFNPSQVAGTSNLTATYTTLIELVNLQNTLITSKTFTAGVDSFFLRVGSDPTVTILDRDTLYCEYDNYSRIRVTPLPVLGATSVFNILNLADNSSTNITPNSLGEVYINPDQLDPANDGDTEFLLSYTYSQLGCTRSDNITILVPEPLNAGFSTASGLTDYCSSGLPDMLIPVTDTSDARVNDNNTFFSVDNISIPNRTFTPGVSQNPTVSVVGPHTVTYQIQDTFGCLTSSSQIFTVNALPILSLAIQQPSYCADANIQTINVSTFPNSGGVGTFSRSTRGAGRVTISPISVPPYVPNPIPSTNPNYSVDPDVLMVGQTIADTIRFHYTFTDLNSCTDSLSRSAIIHPAPAITFVTIPPINCLDSSLVVNLNPVPANVNISTSHPANGNIDLVNARFTPVAVVNNQTITYSYTDALTNCVNSLTNTFRVISDSTSFAFVAPALPNYICKADTVPIQLLVARTGSSFVTGRQFTSNRTPNGLTSLGGALTTSIDTVRFIPSRSDTGNVIVSYSATLSGSGCSKTIRDTIYVHKPAPIFLEFIDAVDGDSICEYAQTVIFIQNYPQSSIPLPPRLDTIRGSNAPSQQGVQRVTSIRYDFVPNAITYANRLQWHYIQANVTDNYGCAVSVTDSIKVIANPYPFINGLDGAYCHNTGVDTITGAPQGGNWYEITNGTKYSLQPYQSASIADSSSSPIVGATTPNPISFGANAGTFIFNPNTIDTTQVIYEVQYANGCINRDSQDVVVYPLPNLLIDPLPTLVCSNDDPIPLTSTVNGVASYSPSVQYREALPGGIVLDTLFNPSAQIPGPVVDSLPRMIVATYTFAGSGCSDTDTLRLMVRRPPNATILGLSSAYCVNALPNTINGDNLDLVGNAAGIASATFSSLDPGVVVQQSNTQATFNPALIAGGSDIVTYTVVAPNGCQDSEERTIISNPLPSGLSVFIPSNILCENGSVSTVTGLPVPTAPANGSFSVLNPASLQVDTSNNNTLNLRPAHYATISGVGNYRLVYRYQDANGCVNTDTSILELHPRPQAYFHQQTFCIGNTIRLQDSSYFNAFLTSADSLRFWNWSYQGQSFANNTDNFLDLQNLPAGSGIAQVVVTSGANCRDTFQRVVQVYNNPQIAFATTGGCMGTPISFMPDSTELVVPIDSVSQIVWDFGDGTTQVATAVGGNTQIAPVTHLYATAGIYFPSLYVLNRGYCEGSDTNRLAISPSVDLALGAYSEDFEATDGTWFQSLPNAQAVWQWGIANKDQLTTAPTGNKVWVTNLTQPYPQNTDTWVYAPCFDFTTSIKPMIKLDIAADMYSYDGVALQYFDDQLLRWVTVGEEAKGVNWYNNESALGLYDYDPTEPYLPGVSSLNAWSSTVGFIGTNNATAMQTARYRLDQLKGRNNVQFRIAFGGLNTPNLSAKEGFMFDNVWVGERRRNVLIEHFSNMNHPNMGVNTQHVNGLIFNQHNIHDLVLIEYHTELGTPDNLYYESAPGNNARRLEYGAQNAQAVVDGNAWLDNSLLLNGDILDTEMLQDPEFSIQGLNLFINQLTNTATITATIRAEKDLPQQLYSIFPVIVEDSISWLTQLGFVNQMGTFRQFLPTTVGLQRDQAWATGDSLLVQETWAISIGSVRRDNLEAVVFVQAPNRKVMQAAHTRTVDVLTLPQFPISVEYLEELQAQGREVFNVQLFPNPAVDYTQLRFDAPLRGEYRYQIIDVQGRILSQAAIPANSQLVEISTENLAAGTYIIYVFDPLQSVRTSRKLTVIRP